MLWTFLLLLFSLFPTQVNRSLLELGFKFDGISVRTAWKSNLGIGDKIIENAFEIHWAQ